MAQLALYALLGFLRLVVFLGAILFGLSGTTHYWQAWVYMLVFVVSCALITAYLWEKDRNLLARRLNAGVNAEKEKRQKWIQLFAALVFATTLGLPAIDHRFAWSVVPLWLVVAGDLFVALGFIIVFLVFRQNTFAAATIQVDPDQEVVSTGPYAIVRHPMYAGALVLLAATPLALGSWWGLVMLAPFLLVLVVRLIYEETFLRQNLPGYAAYCQKVRYRLIPLVW